MQIQLWIKGIILLCAVQLVGCTSLATPPALENPAGLQVATDSEGTQARIPQALHWRSVSIDAIDWQASAEISTTTQAQLRQVLQDALQTELAAGQSSRGIPLRIRARILQVSEVSPALNIASSLLIFTPVDRGGAVVQIEALDRDSGQRLAYFAKAQSAALTDVSGYFSGYAHAESALRRAAEAFRQFLEQNNDAHRQPGA